MKKNILLYLLVILMACMGSTFAAGLNVVLNSQNPDPVSPGNFVYANIKVSNTGTQTVKEATIRYTENKNLKLAQGEERIKNLGSLPPTTLTSSGGSLTIAKYKLFVSEDAPIGENSIKVVINADGILTEYEFMVLVQDRNPTLFIENVELSEIEPGKSETMKLTLKNSNSINLKDVVLTLDLDDVDDKVLSTKGSNQVVIGNIAAKSSKEIKFDLTVSPEAEAKPYLLPLEINYEDSLGNVFTKTSQVAVRVYSKPDLSVKLDSQENLGVGRGKVTFAIANPGTSTIRGVELELMDGEGYTVVDGDYNYVGDLNPDDFQTIQADVYVSDLKAKPLKLKVSYADSYNNQKEEMYELPMKLYTASEQKELGLVTESTNVGTYLIVLLIIGGVFFYYRKRKHNKRK